MIVYYYFLYQTLSLMIVLKKSVFIIFFIIVSFIHSFVFTYDSLLLLHKTQNSVFILIFSTILSYIKFSSHLPYCMRFKDVNNSCILSFIIYLKFIELLNTKLLENHFGNVSNIRYCSLFSPSYYLYL